MKFENKIILKLKLELQESFRKISKYLGVHITTVSNEVKNNRKVVKNRKTFSLDSKIKESEILTNHPCNLIKKSPYVCNGCIRYLNNNCTYHYIVYSPDESELKKSIKKETKILAKKHILNEIQKYINMGQTISHIEIHMKRTYPDEMISKSTIYNYIDLGYIEHNKKKIKSKSIKHNTEKVSYTKRYNFLKGQEYLDFMDYCKNNKVTSYVEMDLLCGNKYTKGAILTFLIHPCQLTLAYKLKNRTTSEVLRVFDELERKLGYTTLKKIFGVILTDRGFEFMKYKELSTSIINNRKRCEIYFCDKATPTQKPYIENVHKLFRKVILKGRDIDKYTNEDLLEIINNINGLRKSRYDGKSPNEMFIEKFGFSIFKKLSLELYEDKDIILLPNEKK